VENWQAIPERNVLRADVIVAPLDFVAEIIWETIGDTFTTMHAQYIPGWWESFMGTWSRFMMRTIGSYFRHQFRGMSFRLILRLSMPSLMFQYCLFLKVPSQRLWRLLPWSNSGISFMPILRAMSELMLLSRLVHSLPHTDYIIFGPQLIEVSLCWKELSFCMLCVWGCHSACVSTSSTLYWRWEMRDEHSTRLPFACLNTNIILQSGIDVVSILYWLHSG